MINHITRASLQSLVRRHWDVIHIHTPFRTHALGMRLAQRTGRPTVETYHTYFEEYVAHYLPSPLLVARRVSRKLCGDVDHLIVPSRQMVEVLQGYGIATPATILPTGLALEEFAYGDGTRYGLMQQAVALYAQLREAA